jgi:glycosyltransferase involved in cell wall biosynthesis
VTLHDAWVSCPVAFRVRPDTSVTCEVPAGPHPCVACAGVLAPRTPWVPTDEAWMAFSRRQQDLTRELELARIVTTPSAAHAAAIEAWLGLSAGALEARVVPPARMRRDPSPAPASEPPAVAGRLRLVSWAGLAAHKGADLLLQALERAALAGRVELTLVGAPVDADFAHRLRNAAVGLDMQFTGPCEPHELGRRAAGAHAFVTATRAQESYGLALDEALELGLPVVAPRTPAFDERFGDGSAALLFEPGDADSLASGLQRLLDEAELWPRLVQGAREHGGNYVDPDEVATRMAELYGLAVQAGAPQVREPEWFEARMIEEALRVWDTSLTRCEAAELGLEP